MDFEQATEALAKAVGDEESPPTPEAGEQAVSAPQDDAGTTHEDSFTGIDPNSLPPELLAIYKSMQGDYTRSKQALKEQLRAFEEFGDPDEVRKAVEFVTALQSDPYVAYQTVRQLESALQEYGFQLDDDSQPESGTTYEQPDYGDESESDLDDPLAREIAELRSWKEQLEQAALEAAREAEQQRLISQMEQQEMAIRRANEHYTDDDINYIYDLAISRGGDLLEAEKAYKALQNRLLNEYLNSKASVPSGVTSPTSGGGLAQEPQEIPDLDAAHKIALERLRAAGLA